MMTQIHSGPGIAQLLRIVNPLAHAGMSLPLLGRHGSVTI
jgi:hypothetical protein